VSQLEKVAREFRNLLVLMKTEYFRPADHITRSRLSPAQFHTLSILYRQGLMPMSDLAGELKVSKQQLTQLISKLLESNMVLREPDPHDRRAVRIDITPEGRKIVETLGAEIKKNLVNKLRLIPPDELGELEHLLIRMNAILKKCQVADLCDPVNQKGGGDDE